MPLFGNKDKHHTTEHAVGQSTLNPATGPATGTGVGGTDYATGTGAMNAGTNTTGLHHGAHHGAGNLAGVGSGYNNEPGYGGSAGMQHDPLGISADTGIAGQHHTQPMAGATEIPPSRALNTSDHGRHGQGGTMSGKAERAIGTLVGSQSLKAKGAEKEAEARAMHQQGAELSEAERLEAEAKMRRERAVAHGAHPENINLGSGVGTNQMRGSGWS